MSQRKIRRLRKQYEADRVGVSGKGNQVTEKGILEIIKENWKFLAVLCVGTSLLYLNAMRADFVSDDYATIPQNQGVADFGYAWATTPNFANLSNTLVAVFFGIESTIPYHVYSLSVFLVVCIFVFIFIHLLMGRTVAVLTVLIFAVHPIHVEAVSWISGKPYTLSALFLLPILISMTRLLETGEKMWMWMILILMPLSYKAEPIRSLTIFFLIPLLLLYKGIRDAKIDLKKVTLFVLLVLPILLVFMWPRIMHRVNVVNSGVNVSDSIFYNPFFQYPTAVTKYLQILLVPVDLTLYHTMYVFPTWLNWVVFLIYIISVVYFFFRDKRVFFALSFIFVASVSSMAPVKVAWLVAERYIFLGSLGFCLLLGIIISEGIKRGFRIGSIVILASLIVIFGVRSYLRNVDWQTNHNLWVNTCQISPNSHNAWNNIGDDYDKLKDYGNAIKGFSQSTVVKPNYADAYHNRANILFKIGRLDLARESYMTALYFSPGLMQSYLSLTQIDLIEKRFDLALAHAQKAVDLAPGSTQPLYVLAIVKAQAGNKEEAINILKAVVKTDPSFRPAAETLMTLSAAQS